MHQESTLRRAWAVSTAFAAAITLASAPVWAQARATETTAETQETPKKQPRIAAKPEAKATGSATPATEPTSDAESGAEAGADGDGEGADGDQQAAPSAEEREEARLAFEAGTVAFEEERYEEAALAFQKAQQLIPSPHAEFWIALSLDKADPENEDAAKIAKAYQIYLSNPGAEHVGAEQLTQAKERYESLRRALPATVTIESEPAGAQVIIDGELQEGVTPFTFEGKEGTYQVELRLEGYEDTTVEVVAEGGIALEQRVQLSETPAPAPPAPAPETLAAPEENKKNMVPAIVTLGLGGAGLISGTVFGIMALNSKSKFKDDPTTDNADAAERNALIADMSFGIALTLGVTGIVLLTSGDGEADTPATAQARKNEFVVAPYATLEGAGAAARWTF